MSTTRIPPILEPYTRLPRAGELVLLTNVLGAGTNWLVSQFLCAALAEKPRDEGTRGSGGIGDEEKEEETAVVLVSWMRDLEFWRGEGRKAWGLDLARLAQRKRFAFVDGLTQLFVPGTDTRGHDQPQASPLPPLGSPLPLRSGRTITPRGIPSSVSNPSPTAVSQTLPPSSAATPALSGSPKLTSPSLKLLESTILDAISELSTQHSLKRILLILDHPDLLLATGSISPSSPQHISDTSTELEPLRALLHSLRHHVHAMVITIAADAPLLNSTATPLETNHTAFLVGLAHVADLMLSVRLLDTGFARDVSGVVRVSEREGEEGSGGGGREVLYHVGRDGVVKAFERGGAGGVGEGG